VSSIRAARGARALNNSKFIFLAPVLDYYRATRMHNAVIICGKMSVCSSVPLSVRQTPVLCRNG